jgi:hypothetical protein
MLRDPTHSRWRQESWDTKEKLFILKDKVVYQLAQAYDKSKWLKEQSSLFEENKWKYYIPIASRVMCGGIVTYTGYLWERANMANWLLTDENYKEYPNLRWCDVGNHPYPSEIRRGNSYLQSMFNRYANKLIFPHHDITKAVIFPSELCPSTPL